MQAEKSFTHKDYELLFSELPPETVFRSQAGEDAPESAAVIAAAKIDPTLLMKAVGVAFLSPENFMKAFNVYAEISEDSEEHESLQIWFKHYDYGQAGLEDNQTLKDYMIENPYTLTTQMILKTGVFSDSFILDRIRFYSEEKRREFRIDSSKMLVVLTRSKMKNPAMREILFYHLSERRCSEQIFYLDLDNEDEFFKFFDLVSDHLKHFSLVSKRSPDFLKLEYIERRDWALLHPYLDSNNISEEMQYIIMDAILSELGENKSSSFIEALATFTVNANVSVKIIYRIFSSEKIFEYPDMFEQIFFITGFRNQEDERLIDVVKNILDRIEDPEDRHTLVSLLIGSVVGNKEINPDTADALIEYAGQQDPIFQKMKMFPRPNMGDLKAAEVMNQAIGTPLETAFIGMSNNASALALLENRSNELSYKTKLVLMVNKYVPVKTYLEFALYEEDLTLQQMFMRAGGESYIDSKIGHLFLNSLSTVEKMTAWVDTGGFAIDDRVVYATLTVNV